MDEPFYLQLILALLQQVGGDTSSHAREYVPYVIEYDTTLSRAAILNEIYGLPAAYLDRQDILTAIQNVRLDTASPHIATITDVLDALANMPPITLPEPPPPGYGGGDLSEVWLSNLETYDWCPVD